MSEQASNVVPLPAEVSPASGEPGRERAHAPRKSEEEIDRIIAHGLAEFRWIYDERAAGRLKEYQGQHIAVVNQKVVASDPNGCRLNQRLADELHLDPREVITCYIEGLE